MFRISQRGGKITTVWTVSLVIQHVADTTRSSCCATKCNDLQHSCNTNGASVYSSMSPWIYVGVQTSRSGIAPLEVRFSFGKGQERKRSWPRYFFLSHLFLTLYFATSRDSRLCRPMSYTQLCFLSFFLGKVRCPHWLPRSEFILQNSFPYGEFLPEAVDICREV